MAETLWTYALTSLARTKDFLQETTTDHDDLLTLLISAVSRASEKWCGTYLKERTAIVEYHNGEGGTIVFTDNIPITTFTSMYEDTDRDFAADTLVDSDDYYVTESIGKIERDDEEFETGVGSIKLTYNAGYSTIPEDLQLACWTWVAHIFKERDKGSWHMASLGAGGETTAFVLDKPPADVQTLLAQYKRPRL